jgi:hypothetical protein
VLSARALASSCPPSPPSLFRRRPAAFAVSWNAGGVGPVQHRRQRLGRLVAAASSPRRIRKGHDEQRPRSSLDNLASGEYLAELV